MAPMKVYGWVVSPWMARVLVALEEAGAEYEVVPMSRSGGDHRRPEHLARNVREPLIILALYLLRMLRKLVQRVRATYSAG
jgi:glutathione S-transferase